MSDATTQENLNYLRIVDLQRELAALTVRHDAMEKFIKDQYPMHFAGDVGTIADPDLAPVGVAPLADENRRADPATCKHLEQISKAVPWSDTPVKYCVDCGAVMQPKKDTTDGPGK